MHQRSVIHSAGKRERATRTVTPGKKGKSIHRLVFYRYLKSTHIRRIPCPIKSSCSQPNQRLSVALVFLSPFLVSFSWRPPTQMWSLIWKRRQDKSAFIWRSLPLLNKIFSSLFFFFFPGSMFSVLFSRELLAYLYFQLSSARHTYLTSYQCAA